jgi:hypothetical protein
MTRNLAAYADVDLVIDLEARGVKGRAVMFETGRNNLATLRLYRNARWPFAYSFAVPPATTRTTSPSDPSSITANRSSPSCSSTRAIRATGDRAPSPPRRTWSTSTWLPGVLVSYPATAAKLIGILTTILFVAWTACAFVRKEARIGSALLWFLAWLGMAALALGIGLGASVLLASRRARRGGEIGSLLVAALALNLLMLAVFHRFLPSGSFMFALPVLAALAGHGSPPAPGAVGIVTLLAFFPLTPVGPLLLIGRAPPRL